MEPTCEPTSPPKAAVISGSCVCGKVTYQSSTLPLSVTLCHCVQCRKVSGAPFLTFGLFHNTALNWSSPSFDGPPIKLTASPATKWGPSMAVRGSCGSCGSPLFMKYHCRPDGTSVVMGIVDDASVTGKIARPKEHIFLTERATWWTLAECDGLARHDEFNHGFQARLKAWNVAGCPKRSDVGSDSSLQDPA
ncbi:MAG: hypothetical protein Q9223_005952 [Gallowayella weberi]